MDEVSHKLRGRVFKNRISGPALFNVAALQNEDMIRQFQVVRRATEALEMKLVATRKLSDAEAAQLTKILQERFRHPFAVSFSYQDEISRSAGGKFEDYKDESETGR